MSLAIAKPRSSPADKREAILAASLDLFAERGFHGTAMPLVAERANVGTGTIYRHFVSKEGLVNALYQKWKVAFGEAMLDDFPFSGHIREQFRTFFHRFMAFSQKHPTAVAFMELHHHTKYLDETSRGLEERLLSMALTVLEDARRAGTVKDIPVELMIAMIFGTLHALVKECCWRGRFALGPQELEQSELCLWEAIKR